MQKRGKPSRCNHFSEHEQTLVENCLPFFPWCLTICAWETSINFWTWTGKSSVKIMVGRGFAHLSNGTCSFLQVQKSTAKLLCFTCLFGCYIQFIRKVFAHPYFLEQKYWDKPKKGWFAIFLSKFNPLNLKVKASPCDTSSTVSTWSYDAAFHRCTGRLVLELGCYIFSESCVLTS